ncbi:C1 family peptidase [Candidatus Poriferisodalis sp.]|uniref:C1 family peptidase n=1 Tax=Candidatus Poriferisodalis sp. TaxID=3101277 RepID=UPI003B520972
MAIGTASRGGTILEAVADALRTVGQPSLVVWPFNSAIGHGADQVPSAAQVSVWHQAELTPVSVANDGIEDVIEDLLAAGLVVALIIEITTEFEQAAPEGTIEVPPLTAPQGAYHAVLVVGARTHEQVRVLLVRNSWGPGWGAGGYGWLPTDYLIAFGARAGAIDPLSLTSGSLPSTWRIDS